MSGGNLFFVSCLPSFSFGMLILSSLSLLLLFSLFIICAVPLSLRLSLSVCSFSVLYHRYCYFICFSYVCTSSYSVDTLHCLSFWCRIGITRVPHIPFHVQACHSFGIYVVSQLAFPPLLLLLLFIDNSYYVLI